MFTCIGIYSRGTCYVLTLIQNDNDNFTSKNWNTWVCKLDKEHFVVVILGHTVLKNGDDYTFTGDAIDAEQEGYLNSKIIYINCMCVRESRK